MDKPDQDEIDEAMALSADQNSPLGILKRHKRWAEEQIAQLQGRLEHQAETIRVEIPRLETNLADARKRDLNKGAEITKLREENDKLRNFYAQQTGCRWGVQVPKTESLVAIEGAPKWEQVLDAALANIAGLCPQAQLKVISWALSDSGS